MGRGRQKAKQTKVARQLKYFSPDTDYDALQRELTTSGGPSPRVVDGDSDADGNGAGPSDAYDEDDWGSRSSAR